jgi:hypothetical protein
MTVYLARPLQSDRNPESAPGPGVATVVDDDHPTAQETPSPARARQAMVEDYAAEQAAPTPPVLRQKRGALRPAQLISTRKRHETAAAERLFRTADGSVAVLLAMLCVALDHPEGLLKAPIGAVLPLAAGAWSLIWSLRVVRAYGLDHREGLSATLARIASALLASASAAALVALLARTPAVDVVAADRGLARQRAADAEYRRRRRHRQRSQIDRKGPRKRKARGAGHLR